MTGRTHATRLQTIGPRRTRQGGRIIKSQTPEDRNVGLPCTMTVVELATPRSLVEMLVWKSHVHVMVRGSGLEVELDPAIGSNIEEGPTDIYNFLPLQWLCVAYLHYGPS